MRSAPNEKEVAAQDALEEAITKTSALLEVLEILRSPIGDSSDFIPVNMTTLEGLNLLSKEQGKNLFARFDELVQASTPNEKAAHR